MKSLKMKKFDLSKVEFSNNDLKLGIKVPEYLTEDLAYFLGFHVGDGSMNILRRKNTVDYRLGYDGHKINEKKWYEDFIIPLIKRLFNKELSIHETTKGTVRVLFRSKKVLTFLHYICDIPLGPKKYITVPKIILESTEKIKANFLRGIADTDFSICFKKSGKYPVITHGTYSETLHNSLKMLISDLGFNYYSASFKRERKCTKLITYRIDINGRRSLNKWMELVGFSSYNAYTRYLVWKETGNLPPKTDINDRMKILIERGIKFP